MDRINQAYNYMADAMEFLQRAVKELNPETCNLCPKEAVYFFGAAKTCDEHVSDEIRSATVDKLAKKVIKDKAGSVIITPADAKEEPK